MDTKYTATARSLGEEIARRQWTLVWGGSRSGLMGAVAEGAREAGGRTIGILPQFIHEWEVTDHKADELMIVTTMHERKLLLQTRSDVFVILPGGVGTLDEIGDTLDLRNLDRHGKSIVIVNQDGYYDKLLGFLEHSIAEKFTKTKVREHLKVVATVEEAIAYLEALAASGSKRHASSNR